MGNMDATNLLLEHGADLYKPNKEGMTAIDEIIRADHKDLLSCLIKEAKAQKRDTKQPGSYSILHLAAGNKGKHCLSYLLE